ncbi:hypothetical protein DFH27DRAFT_52831 [Peziza echinospora]|nr:hypothetical protein DFH27DRAFT_52831 [Peziza echinospora]
MIDGNKHHIGYGLGNHMINTQAYVIWVTWLLFGIGSFVAVARLTARKICGLPLGLEEYFVIFSLINWVTDVVAIPYLVLNGTNAMTAEMRKAMVPDSDEWIKRTAASKLFIFAWFTYLFMLWSLKASILLFYGRVTKGAREQKNVRYAWYALGVSMLACVIALFTVCRPFHKNWQIYPDPGRNCTDGIKYVWILGIFNIATDLMLLAIPLPIVLRLQTTPRRKIMLSILFGLGFFVIIATALRIHFTILGGDVQAMTFWCMIETCIAMIVANCPGVRHFPPTRSSHQHAFFVLCCFHFYFFNPTLPTLFLMHEDRKFC